MKPLKNLLKFLLISRCVHYLTAKYKYLLSILTQTITVVNIQKFFFTLSSRRVLNSKLYIAGSFKKCEGEGEVAFFSAKRWDRRSRADLIESATPCHDAQVVGLYRDSNPLRLTILAAMSEDYTTAPQHLQNCANDFGSCKQCAVTSRKE